MKARTALFTVLFWLAGISGVLGGNGNIPLPSGKFSVTSTGSLAICFNSDFTMTVACNTTGAVAIPLTFLQAGSETIDKSGNVCAAYVSTISNLPVDATPPSVTNNNTSVLTLTNYDPNTGTGDWAFTSYTGGKCNGSTFDDTGAKQSSTGTEHFVVSQQGKAIDAVITQLTDPTNGIGDFSISVSIRTQ